MAFEWRGPQIMAKFRAAGKRVVARGTESVKERMIERIQDGNKSGRVYVRNGVEHQASAPGESPASDTGRLVQSITTSYNPAKIEGRVNVSADYAFALEVGTAKMAARPYARVSLMEKLPEIQADAAREFAKATKK